jgi:hypothetical protein
METDMSLCVDTPAPTSQSCRHGQGAACLLAVRKPICSYESVVAVVVSCPEQKGHTSAKLLTLRAQLRGAHAEGEVKWELSCTASCMNEPKARFYLPQIT